MSHVLALLAIRAHFALTQTELAAWLGLGRSMLAMVETGQEQLPRHAWPWLRPWQAALAAALAEEPPAPLPPLPPLPTTGPAAVWARLAECHYQAQRLGQQLARLQAAHRTAARRLAAGPLLLASLPAPTPAEPEALARRRRWLARLLEAATDALAPEAAAGPVAAALLAARRQAGLHEARLLLAYLQGEEVK
jgi:hypothetical protein